MTDGDGKTGGGAPAPMKIPGMGSGPAKRFYKDVAASPSPLASGETGEGALFRVLLDRRPLRTPAKRIIALPARALAEAVAAEWEAQVEHIRPSTMPMTRLINSALDGVAGREREVREDIVKYAGNDLVCYRADHPPDLVARQAEVWDPILDWAAGEIGGRFACGVGIAHVAQPPPLLQRLLVRLDGLGVLRLAALRVMTAMTGSALIAWATASGHCSADAAWTAAHVDEDWQIAQWGADAEAEARRRQRWSDFEAASRLCRALA